jgi:hypothetical protein
MKLGVIIFCSVRFLPIKTTKLKFCKIQKKKSKSVKTDRFWFYYIRFGLVIYIKNQKLYCFLVFFKLFNGFGFGLVQFFLFGLVFRF